MASKGPKSGKPAASKPPVAKPVSVKAAPKPDVVAVAAKKPAPIAEAEVAPVAVEPVPAVEVPQEVEAVAEPVAEAVEAVEAPVAEALEPAAVEVQEKIETVVTETVAAAEAVTDSIKEPKIMTTIETNVAKAQAFFADFNDRAKAAYEKSTKFAAEANEFTKGNVEAMVESGKIAANGLQVLGQDAAEYSRKSFETATAALKGLSAAKSPTDFFKLQSDYYRSAFDSAVAETSKTTEALIKLASDVSQPLSNRVALAVEKVKVAA